MVLQCNVKQQHWIEWAVKTTLMSILKHFNSIEEFLLPTYFVVFCLTDYYLMMHMSLNSDLFVCPMKMAPVCPLASAQRVHHHTGGGLLVTLC